MVMYTAKACCKQVRSPQHQMQRIFPLLHSFPNGIGLSDSTNLQKRRAIHQLLRQNQPYLWRKLHICYSCQLFPFFFFYTKKCIYSMLLHPPPTIFSKETLCNIYTERESANFDIDVTLMPIPSLLFVGLIVGDIQTNNFVLNEIQFNHFFL